MVKEQRSSRTRQWPVRSGALRGAKRTILPRLPLRAMTRRRRPIGYSACSRTRRPATTRPGTRPDLRTSCARHLARPRVCRPRAGRRPVFIRDRRVSVTPRRKTRAPPRSIRLPPGRLRRGQVHETHAVQRHPGRRAAGGHRRRPEADRPRHRVRQQGTTQEQHLQRRHHPRRAQSSKPCFVDYGAERHGFLPFKEISRSYFKRRRRRRHAPASRTRCAKARSSSSRSTRTSAATRARR